MGQNMTGTWLLRNGPERRKALNWLPFLRNFVEARGTCGGGKVPLVKSLWERVTTKLRTNTITPRAKDKTGSQHWAGSFHCKPLEWGFVFGSQANISRGICISIPFRNLTWEGLLARSTVLSRGMGCQRVRVLGAIAVRQSKEARELIKEGEGEEGGKEGRERRGGRLWGREESKKE